MAKKSSAKIGLKNKYGMRPVSFGDISLRLTIAR